jgi:PTS system N-acetylgalactosamine-specific IID component
MASKVLTKKDYIKTSLRAYFLQNGFNYGNYQGLGYANMLYPALRKLYKDDDDALQAALQDNLEFYNTNIHFVPFVTSLHLVMLENGTPNSEIRNIKMALMGPLAGIGDSLSQFVLAPLLGTIGASLAYEGMMAGPIIYLLGMNLILLAVKIMCGLLGYNLGTSIIGTMTEQIEKVSRIASMIGVTVIAGLAVSFVKITTPIQYAVAVPGGEQKLVTLQSMLDAIAPSMLPCAFVGLVFYLIKVKKWTTVKLVCMTIVLGILLSVLGIVA